MTDDSLSDDDKALFRKFTQDVTPIKAKKPRVHTTKSKPDAKPIKQPTKEPNRITENYLSDYISDPVLSNSLLSYAKPGLPTKRLSALRLGKIAVEARLDLHGLQADSARDALYHFIKIKSQEEVRCILVIHGKGGQQGAPPVIKNLVNRWLPQLSEVLAFHSAQPRHGGLGAVYVLLRACAPGSL